MQIRKVLIITVFSFILIPRTLIAADQSPQKPNIVWIWADNLAYGDLGVYGNKAIKTPVIDNLAREGVRFTQYYIGHCVCSPSRAAFITGRQPFRVGIVDVLRQDGPTGMPTDEITLAEALKQQGYATAAFGKWHLGDRKEFLPLQHGFDTFLGLPYSMDMAPTLLYQDNDILEALPGDKVQDVTTRITDKAIEFIEASRDRPFFIYFSHTIPHPPLNIPPQYRTPDRPIYDDALEYMDEQTGRLLDAIERHGLSDNTLVFFSSDNGPWHNGGNTAGLRGRIIDTYEGGVRVPLIARWPGKIPAGRVVDTPAIAYDIFPTLVNLAGGSVPQGRIYDGQDIWPLLTGEGLFERHQPFIWVYHDRVTSIRDGKWKMHVAHRAKPLKSPELYNLDKDPYEKHRVNKKHPDVVNRLQKIIQDFETQIPSVWILRYPVRDPVKAKGGMRKK